VVLGVVNGVDPNRVETELLELGDIALAALRVSNGVLGVGSSTRLVVNAADIEALVASEESCGGLVPLECITRRPVRTVSLHGDRSDAGGTLGGGECSRCCGSARSEHSGSERELHDDGWDM
jgi:hypothetical protein